MKVSSTIGFERRHNELLAIEDEQRFIERSLATLGPQPPNFRAIVELNRGSLSLHEFSVRPLTPRQVEQKGTEGALIVDVRTALQFDEAHIPGAVSNPALHAGFGTRLAWIADRDQDLVFVGRDDDDAAEAAGLAAAVGLRRFGGVLAGGMTSWREARRPTRGVERLTVPELHDRGLDRVQILDVREQTEWAERHIPGSIHRPYHDLDRVPSELNERLPTAVICSSGQRSGLAASLLQRFGAGNVLHVVDGGVGTWAESGWPIERAGGPPWRR